MSPAFYQVHSSAQICLCQTPGRRPPRITARFVNTVTRGWVEAPSERAPFRFQGAVIGFVDLCRGLGISPLRIKSWLSFSQADLGPASAQYCFFSVFFSSLEPLFYEICAHSERYRSLTAGISEFKLFLATSRFHCYRSKPLQSILEESLH